MRLTKNLNNPLKGSIVAVFALLASLIVVMDASAIGTRIIVNSGFEDPGIVADCGGGSFRFINSNAMPGWNTTHPERTDLNCGDVTGRPIETWRDGTVVGNAQYLSQAGSQFVELNAYAASFLYQNLCLLAGESVSYSYYHLRRISSATEQTRARLTTDTGTVIQESAVHDSVYGSWTEHTGSLTNSGATRELRYGFAAVGTGSLGNFIDSVTIDLPALTEIKGFNSSTLNESDDLFLEVYVSGTLDGEARLTLQRASSSTADPTTNYTINTGAINRGSVESFDETSGLITLSLPAGDYDPNESTGNTTGLIRIPVNIVSNGDAGSDFQLSYNNGSILTGGGSSSSRDLRFEDASCDGTNVTQAPATTVADDDQVPTIDSVTANASSIVTVTGTAYQGSTVYVTFPDGSTRDATADSSGAYSISSSNQQPPGEIEVYAQDADGNSTEAVEDEFIPDVDSLSCSKRASFNHQQ